ncbi:MAG: DUF2851 family protein [Bacteroidota bacterium]
MSLFGQLPEDFLHVVWKSLHFSLSTLQTTDGQSIQIISPGIHNQDAGPDFLDAQLRIGGMQWFGHVEIHLDSEDWYRHKHQHDPAYDAVVLHVVGKSGKRLAQRSDGSHIPELSLEGRIPAEAVRRYHHLQLNQRQIPCEGLQDNISAAIKTQWVEELSRRRLQEKTQQMRLQLKQNVQDWDQVLWEQLMRYLGGPVNQAAFENLSQRIPYRILNSYRSRPLALEAVLLGGSGCLSGSAQDEYQEALQTEWQFLRAKHDLSASPPFALKFSRMRPAGFPTIRLAQMAQVITECYPLGQLLEPEGMQAFIAKEIRASHYWDTHYRVGIPGKGSPKRLGEMYKRILLTNVLLPLRWIQLHQKSDQGDPWQEISNTLQTFPKELNRHTRPLTSLKFPHQHAMHSQGLIELYRTYCEPHRCLHCEIGQEILSSK